jgi:hypothetical protein
VAGPDLAELIGAWANRTREVKAAVLIGSRAPRTEALARAETASDWDFQIFPSAVEPYLRPDWLRGLGLGRVEGYVPRRPLWGGGWRCELLLPDAEADLLLVPYRRLRGLRVAAALALHRRRPSLRRALESLAEIIRPGWRFLKGPAWLEPFYRRAVADFPEPRLGDAEVRRLAAGVRCDHRWTVRKLEAGELRAAQRMLHLGLAEANFRLLHELRLRRGERAFRGARRLERLAESGELAAVTVSAACDGPSLRAAADHAAAACEELAARLLGRGPPGLTPAAAR